MINIILLRFSILFSWLWLTDKLNSSDISSSGAPNAAIPNYSSHVIGINNATSNHSESLVSTASEGLNNLEAVGNVIQNLGGEDVEFYRILSITTLKFVFCLIGKYSPNIYY